MIQCLDDVPQSRMWCVVCVSTLAISRGIMEMASGILDTMPARALVKADPLFSDTPV